MTVDLKISIAEASRRLRRGEITSVGLTEASLARIEAVEPSLNAFITVTGDAALKEATRADRELAAGRDRGPLHGIPIGLKDLCDTKGVLTTAGSKLHEDRIPTKDATVVRKLRSAGAVSLGKLNLHELAYGTHSANPWYGPVHNPWDLECHPGGSSGGSGAAVAAFECFGATGTDTGGSIRIPAALCGVVGLMPTYGLVSRAGVVPLSWTLDHVGPLARSAEDAALFLNGIAGYDRADPSSARAPRFDATSKLGRSVRGLRIGVPRSQFESCDDDVRSAAETALDVLRDLGATIDDVRIPMLDEGFMSPVLAVEAASFHLEWLRERPEDYSEDVRTLLLWALTVPGHEYVNALRVRREFTDEIATAMETHDLLAWPTCERVAGRISDLRTGGFRYTALTAPWNHTGQPVISVPCGSGAGKLPVGLSLAARPFEEATACQAANALELAAPKLKGEPPI